MPKFIYVYVCVCVCVHGYENEVQTAGVKIFDGFVEFEERKGFFFEDPFVGDL